MSEWIGRFTDRVAIADFAGRGLVAGFVAAGGRELYDVSGLLALPESVTLDPTRSHWLALRFEDDVCEVDFHQVIDASLEVSRHHQSYERALKRWRIHQGIRDWFRSAGFVSVDTPVRVPCPGMEPYLDSFEVGDQWLRTSPELHMKRLLAGGFDKIFQIGPCFRAGDVGSHHREEFLMLEWYRLFADLDHLVRDIGGLLAGLAEFAKEPGYFRQTPEVVTCQALFQQYVGVTLGPPDQREPLEAAHRAKGLDFEAEDDWDTLFFRLFLNCIEPHLGHERPMIVCNYPATQAALAKIAPESDEGLPYAYRFELYIKGIEIANAFYELTDEPEQRARFEADRVLRGKLGKPVYDLDEAFLAALRSGLPPAAGIALGVDRLVMALLGLRRLDRVL